MISLILISWNDLKLAKNCFMLFIFICISKNIYIYNANFLLKKTYGELLYDTPKLLFETHETWETVGWHAETLGRNKWWTAGWLVKLLAKTRRRLLANTPKLPVLTCGRLVPDTSFPPDNPCVNHMGHSGIVLMLAKPQTREGLEFKTLVLTPSKYQIMIRCHESYTCGRHKFLRKVVNKGSSRSSS